MDFAEKIRSFGQRTKDIAVKLATLSERRKEFALGAADGNKTSLKAIQELDTERDELWKERETLTTAIAEAERLQRAQEAEAARADRERRRNEAGEIAKTIANANLEIDAAMVRLRELLEQRAVLVRQLGRTKYYTSDFISKLLQKFGPTSAARAAGLQNFLSLEPVSPHLVRSLADSSRALSAQRLAGPDAKQEKDVA
jgi:chromosome segregation ATPase